MWSERHTYSFVICIKNHIFLIPCHDKTSKSFKLTLAKDLCVCVCVGGGGVYAKMFVS